MTKRFKSKEKDLTVAFDEKIDAVERSSAIARLRFDGFREIEPLLIRLLQHPSFLLRRDAVVTLVGFWHKLPFLDAALNLLKTDADEAVRSGAAFALGEFVVKTGTNKDRVLGELSIRLKSEKHYAVQEECYKSLLKIVAPEKIAVTAYSTFKRERDVDWYLLQPYLG